MGTCYYIPALLLCNACPVHGFERVIGCDSESCKSFRCTSGFLSINKGIRGSCIGNSYCKLCDEAGL